MHAEQPDDPTDVGPSALRRARPDIHCVAADGPQAALRAALRIAAGHPVLFLHETLGLARQALAAAGAQPWPAGLLTAGGAVPAAPAGAAGAAGAAEPASAAELAGLADAADVTATTPLGQAGWFSQWNRGR